MLISIIVPVHNSEEYILQCIDSILAQQFSDFELLLIDDGSQDKSGVICDEYAQKDHRIFTFHKECGGPSSARNFGLNHARGEWIYFMDSDDVLPYDALETYHKAIGGNVDLVMTKYKVIGEDNKLIRKYNKYSVGKFFSQLEFLKMMYTDIAKDYQGYVWNKIFRASIIRENSLRFNENIYYNEDRLFIVQFVSASSKPIRYEDKLTYFYYLHPTGAMAALERKYDLRLVTDFDALVLMKNTIDKLPFGKEIKAYAINAILKSYEWNHELMVKHGVYDNRNHWHMVWGLIKSGAFMMQLRMSLYPFKVMFFPHLCIGRNKIK